MTTKRQQQELEKRQIKSTFWDTVSGLKKPIVVGAVLSTLASLSGVAQPVVTSFVLEAIDDPDRLRTGTAILITLFAAAIIFQYFGGLFLQRAGERQVSQARTLMLDSMMESSVKSIRTANSGDLITRFTGDANALRGILTRDAIRLVTSAIMIIGSLSVMFVLNPELLMICIATMMIPGLLLAVLFPMVSSLAKKQRAAQGVLAGELNRVLKGFSTVRLYGAEQAEQAKVGDEIDNVRRIGLRTALVLASAVALNNTTLQLTFVVALVYGSLFVMDGAMTVPTLVAFIMYITQLTAPASAIVATVNGMQIAWASVERVSDVVNSGDRQVRPNSSPRLSAGAPSSEASSINVDDVTFSYVEGRPILSDLTLGFNEPGLTSIVGTSGSGKSTALEIMSGLLLPESGTVELNEEKVVLGMTAAGDQIVLVEQDSPLLRPTLGENLYYGHTRSPATSFDDPALQSLLDRIGLGHRFSALTDDVGQNGNTLSGGERQRLAIIRGILRGGVILLLDEPTASLDSESEQNVIELLREVSRTQPVIMTSHREAPINASDQVIVMADGAVAHRGTPDALRAIGAMPDQKKPSTVT